MNEQTVKVISREAAPGKWMTRGKKAIASAQKREYSSISNEFTMDAQLPIKYEHKVTSRNDRKEFMKVKLDSLIISECSTDFRGQQSTWTIQET